MARRRPKGEGSIHQRADGKWVGRLYYDDPVTGLARRAQVTGTTKSAVSARLRAMTQRIGAGSPARDDAGLFGVFAARWLESSLPASNRKETTKILYAGLTRNHVISNDLGKLPMKNLRPSSVERFVTQLRAKGLSDSTVRQVYTVARAIADDAVRDGLMARNPFAAVRRPRVTAAEAKFLEPHQIGTLLDATRDSRYGLLFEFLVHTGLRRGEALALKWGDVDLEDRLVQVRGTLARVNGRLVVLDPKSAKSRRTIPLSEAAADVLQRVQQRTEGERERAAQLWVDSRHVFVTDIGEPCDPRNALRALTVASRRAGLDGVGLHTLRHSAASVMLSERVPLNVVSQILGHSGIAITADVYGHIAPDVSRSAVDVLGAALTTSPTPSPQSDSRMYKDAHKDALQRHRPSRSDQYDRK
jgi:integrase